MGFHLVTLLLLVPAIYAKIDVSIVASSDLAHSKSDAVGKNVDIISDIERNTFKLEDDSLKAAVGKYFGKVPDDAFVRKPTPWGDLYTTYGWNQVSRALDAVRTEILDFKTEPIVLLQQEFTNNSSKPASFVGQVKQSITNTVLSSWEKGGELTVSESINYDINFFRSSESSIDLKYTSKWGQGVNIIEELTAGAKDGISLTVQPNQKVIIELGVKKCDMKLKVEYLASLSGLTAVNYSTPYQGHHFWALNINAVMESMALKKSRASSEYMAIGFYSNCIITVKDAATGQVLQEIPAAIYRNN